MAYELKVDMKNAIKTLLERGVSHRKTASMLGVDRKTVDRYAAILKTQNGPQVPDGSTPKNGAAPTGITFQNGPQVPAGSVSENGPQVPAGFSGQKSACHQYRQMILEKIEKGLSARRIYQDLLLGNGFGGSYDAVKRYVRKQLKVHLLPYRRMECEPGAEAQIDFGLGAYIEENGRRKRPCLFRIVLSHSRKAYSECVWHQDTESFLRAIENAFRYFGGVPKTIITDNLKAAVKKADWFDPEINPKLQTFCEHYGTVLLPAKVRCPEHKGKVERAVGYAQNNALKGRVFRSLSEENLYLLDWEKNVADTRIHGTTRRQVRAAFEEEKPHLQKLPQELFPCFEEGVRKVHFDGYVEVAKSYYSVPEEYCRREVWARWDNHSVRIFNMRFKQITIHCRKLPGQFSTVEGHISQKKISAAERGPEWIMKRIAVIGPNAEAWAKAVLHNRNLQGIRPLLGLMQLSRKHKSVNIDEACSKALSSEAFRLDDVRNFIGSAAEQPEFIFMEKHPLIRPMEFYGNIIKKQHPERVS